MKKVLLCIAVLNLCLAAGNSANAEGVGKVALEKRETDQVIVKLKDNAPIGIKRAGTETVKTAGKEQLLAVEIPEGHSVNAFIKKLEAQEHIQSAEPDHLISLSYTPNDPSVDQYQYHHQKIETKTAWDATKGAAGVVVAVIDDGVDVTHPDLKSQIVSPFDTVKESNAIAPGGHGTHVAGIIGSSIDNHIGGSGIAPETKIMPINVFDGETAYISEIVQGIYYAVEKGANIINMSFGGYDFNRSLNEAIQFAHKNGVVIIAAAGNESTQNPYYPASYPNVISVVASTSEDKISTYSNSGVNIDITAPGSSIYSTLPKNKYGTMNGTSMATPMVSGVAALIMANELSINNIEVERRLYSTADDLGAKGKDQIYGNGRLNARKALLINYLPIPKVSGVFNYSVNVKGSATPFVKVVVKAGTAVLNTATADQVGNFTVPIAKQTAGTKLFVYSMNQAGTVSIAKEVVVRDGIAPAMPSVDPVTTKSTRITGQAETAAKVYAYAGSLKLGEAVSVNGLYSIPVSLQKPNASITIYAIDAAGNKSAGKTVTVADKTAPQVPEVNTVSNKSTLISGKTESGTAVYAYAGTKKIGESIAKNGTFSISIARQKNGTSIFVFAVDKAGNKSSAKMVKVVDRIPPAIPAVKPVFNNSLAVSGTAEAHATVQAYVGKRKIGEAIAKNGAFSIKIPKQKAGTAITVFAIDGTKNKSAGKTIKVLNAVSSAPYQTTANVNMRSGASTNHSVLAVVPIGSKVEVIEQKVTWYKVKYGTKIGWMTGAYLKKLP